MLVSRSGQIRSVFDSGDACLQSRYNNLAPSFLILFCFSAKSSRQITKIPWFVPVLNRRTKFFCRHFTLYLFYVFLYVVNIHVPKYRESQSFATKSQCVKFCIIILRRHFLGQTDFFCMILLFLHFGLGYSIAAIQLGTAKTKMLLSHIGFFFKNNKYF